MKTFINRLSYHIFKMTSPINSIKQDFNKTFFRRFFSSASKRLLSFKKFASNQDGTRNQKVNEKSILVRLSKLVPELNEISEIIDGRLYLSGCLPLLQSENPMKFTAIVCALTEQEKRHHNLPRMPSGVKTVYVHLEDSESSDLSAHFRRISSFVRSELNGDDPKKVLIHCAAGVSRSSSLILAYLMRYEKMTLLDALKHVKSKRAIVRPNDGFLKQLIDFEKSINGNAIIDNNEYINTVTEMEKIFADYERSLSIRLAQSQSICSMKKEFIIDRREEIIPIAIF